MGAPLLTDRVRFKPPFGSVGVDVLEVDGDPDVECLELSSGAGVLRAALGKPGFLLLGVEADMVLITRGRLRRCFLVLWYFVVYRRMSRLSIERGGAAVLRFYGTAHVWRESRGGRTQVRYYLVRVSGSVAV
jgi:hypothetical protein